MLDYKNPHYLIYLLLLKVMQKGHTFQNTVSRPEIKSEKCAKSCDFYGLYTKLELLSFGNNSGNGCGFQGHPTAIFGKISVRKTI